MESERWQQIERIYDAALLLKSSARADFLRQTCAGDDALRRAVELLLAQNEKDDDFLELPAMEVAAKVIAQDRLESPSGFPPLQSSAETAVDPASENQSSFGPYRLLEKIGEGGMGEVWLAEQKVPVRRRVALKLIKAGMNTREVIARFESERQALALMDHPAIAKVFDAGTTAQGMPYFVMEYVSGVSITSYCDNHRLSTRDRLELFVHVCEGVQHAHQKAILHRDLKPSNILVTEVDGHPLPKIIDFGVAKALAQKLTADSLYTRIGALIGTPEYMSPEQALSSGEDIDTRSDVYSLGIILYELLAGVPPLELRKAALDEILRKVREDDAPKPSTRIRTQDPATSTDVAHKRHTEPSILVRQIRGELDAISLKALEKDRNRRYGSASEFAADVGRYLRNEPVLAVAPSLAYRARKFGRRHRTGLVTAAAFALVLIAATVVSVRQSIRARREAAVAQAVSSFLQNDLLAQASAAGQSRMKAKPDPNITVRTVLDRAAQKIDGKFATQPEVEIALRNTIGRAYLDLGLYSQARQQLDRALDLGNRTLGTDDPTVLGTQFSLAAVAYYQGRNADAESIDRQVLEARRRALGQNNPDTLVSMSGLAVDYLAEGKYTQAEALDAQALAVSRQVLGPDNPKTLDYISNLAIVYQDEGKYAQAETLNSQALESAERMLGPESPITLGYMYNLASVYFNDGKIAQAEALDLRGLDLTKKELGPEDYTTLRFMSSLANIYVVERKYTQAEALFSQILEVRRRVFGPENFGTLRSMGSLANAYMEEGNYAQAAPIFTQLLEIQNRVLGPEQPDTAETKYLMGCLEARQGDKEKALAFLSDAVDHGLPPFVDLGIATDPDLKSLLSDPRFAALVARAKQRAAASRLSK